MATKPKFIPARDLAPGELAEISVRGKFYFRTGLGLNPETEVCPANGLRCVRLHDAANTDDMTGFLYQQDNSVRPLPSGVYLCGDGCGGLQMLKSCRAEPNNQLLDPDRRLPHWESMGGLEVWDPTSWIPVAGPLDLQKVAAAFPLDF